MTTVAPQPVATRPRPKRTTAKGSFLARAFRTTDHKQIGALILGASMLPFLYNVFKSYRYGEVVTVDNPWDYGNSLEWATSCPPPRHNFTELPRIRSERPAFELHYPHIAERMRPEAHLSLTSKTLAHGDDKAARGAERSEQA